MLARLTAFAIAALCTARLLAPAPAVAQGACPLGQPTPQQITATSLTLNINQSCSFFIFTGGQPTTVTVPVGTAVNPGWQVTLMSTGTPVTVTSTSLINNQTTSQYLSSYVPMYLFGDGSVYWLTMAGTTPSAGPLTNPTSTGSLMPGITQDASSLLLLGNGILKFTNQASFPKNTGPTALSSNICKSVPFGGNQNPPVWLMIYDYLNQPRYLPTC